MKDGTLPNDTKLATKIIAEATLHAISDDILYYIGLTQKDTSQVAVSQQLCQTIMQE